MIKGLGIDIVETARLSEILRRRGRRFVQRVFTPEEEKVCGSSVQRLAGRFAAKEAFFKALGTGFRGFKWQDVEVSNNELGAPALRFCGRVSAHLREIGVVRVHVSISHDREYAVAQVILEENGE